MLGENRYGKGNVRFLRVIKGNEMWDICAKDEKHKRENSSFFVSVVRTF